MLRHRHRSPSHSRAQPRRSVPVSLRTDYLMKTERFDRSSLAAFALVASICVALGVLAVPARMSAVTFMAMILIMMGGSVVALATWSNGRATRTITHVIHDAEVKGRP